MVEPITRGPGPLDGVRVLDLSRVLSGPHCARVLVDLGADVIKVEPPDGDLTRYSWPRFHSIASYFTQQNCGKRNVSLDLKQPRAVDLLRTMARGSDVVLENFRPGVMDRMGLGYDVLSADNPRLVYASITGYGQTGPWKDRRAYAPVVGAESGLTWVQGMARGGSFAAADRVFVLSAPDLGFDPKAALAPLGERLVVAADVQELLARVLDELAAGDHVVLMSNGSFHGLPRLLEQALAERSAE